jgi:preprotein translocase SecE subunit
MAVAVKNASQAVSTRPINRLAFGSLAGIAYVFISLALVLHGLRYLWWDVFGLPENSFVWWALLLLAMVGAGAGLFIVGTRLAGPNPPHGLRSGVVVGFFLVFFAGLFTQAVGVTIENWGVSDSVGMAITAIVGLGLLFLIVRAYFRPGYEKWLGRLEDQGWFTTKPYKRSQGMRVRRGTILGILALAACGIYTLLMRNPLTGDWVIEVPFLTDRFVPLLPYQREIWTLLLAFVSIWLAWRVVNFPAFADFLIATEAEMNKVSWTTRQRLVQDTIVVLTTVVLMTLFLFFVDVLWFKILSNRFIQVLRVDTTAQKTDTVERPEW